jgi:IS1 family transposase
MVHMHGGGGPGDPVRNVESQRNTSGPWNFPPTVLAADAVFDAVAHRRRRYLLYALHSRRNLTLRDLSEKLADWEENSPGGAVETDTGQVYVSLYHTHIPKLESHNVVEYDHNTGVVTPSSNADRVFAALAGAGGNLESMEDPSTFTSLE